MMKRWATGAAILLYSVTAFSFPGGISGRTQKNTTAGCGGSGCHSGGPSSGVTVSIKGPDTLTVGQAVSDTVTVTGTNGTNGGVDIAAFAGTLAPVSSSLKLLNGDVVHKQRVSSPFTYVFTYTAPAVAGKDTLYATGKDNVFSGWNWSAKKILTIRTTTDIGGSGEMSPASVRLMQNYPNPFNGETRIGYRIESSGAGAVVSLRIYDMLGREVAKLVDGHQEPGEHTASWTTGSVSSGVYLSVLTVNGHTVAARKMVLTR